MRLKTKVVNSENKPVRYRMIEIKNEYYHFVDLIIDGKKIGFMRYSLEDDHLYINRMDNFSEGNERSYKQVGTALFEYAFRKSIEAGKEGRIELSAIEASPAAYYKMGLRKKCSSDGQADQQLRHYRSQPTPALKATIQNSSSYAGMRENAVLIIFPELYEKYGYSCYGVPEFEQKKNSLTFEQIIACDFISFRNQGFEQILKQGKRLDKIDCFRAEINGLMYLPPETVAKKRQEFSQSNVPIGGNLFFSREHALANLTNERLKELVEQGKLDPSNAVEIAAKMQAQDPRLVFLLSDLGLKMLKENYISGWFIAVYFHSLASVRAIISENAWQTFEESLVEDIEQFVGLDPKAVCLILSDQGLQALREARIIPISGHSGFKDLEGNYLDSSRLSHILGVPLPQLAP